MRYCFGVDIGGTTVKMGLFGESGEIIDKWEIVTHTENKGEAILPDVAASILNKMKERELSRAVVLGIGVMMEWSTGALIWAGNIRRQKRNWNISQD